MGGLDRKRTQRSGTERTAQTEITKAWPHKGDAARDGSQPVGLPSPQGGAASAEGSSLAITRL